MPHPQRPASSMGVVLIVIIAAFAILATGTSLIVVPVSPSISGTFIVQNEPNLSVNLISANYSKQPFLKGFLSNQSLTLPVQPAMGGPYTVSITIWYNGVLLADQSYYQMGIGTYGFQITWSVFNRQETSGTAYVLTVSVSGNGASNGFSTAIIPS